jgi:hypothetical protein
MQHVDLSGGVIFEPCAGDLAIANVIDESDVGVVFSSDIDKSRTGCSMYGDATERGFWQEALEELGGILWVVTNPPFNQAAQIVPIAHKHARHGIAMLLRLSYLEPTEDRGAWLNNNPPTTLIVLPRISFTGNGKTDSVTCAWMVWDKRADGQRIVIAENPKFANVERIKRTADLAMGHLGYIDR